VLSKTGRSVPFVACLVRHAAFDGMHERLVGRCDVPLSADGRAQCDALMSHFVQAGIQAVYTSPQRRARQTAAILASGLGLEVQPADEFDEVDFGRWAGVSFRELAPDPLWQQFNTARDTARIPDGESLEDVGRRVQRGLTRVSRSSGPAIVVTHAEIVRAAVLLATGRSWRAWSDITIEPASFVRLQFDERWTL
jgi:probable phosphoglycerate mutase